MLSVWLTLAFALVTARGCWAIATALVRDLQADSLPATDTEVLLEFQLGRPDQVGPRVPLNRILAFGGVARRVAARGRWQAGFGRRGL